MKVENPFRYKAGIAPRQTYNLKSPDNKGEEVHKKIGEQQPKSNNAKTLRRSDEIMCNE